MTLLVVIVNPLMEDLPVVEDDLLVEEEDLQEEKEVNLLPMVMIIVMEKKVMKMVVFLVTGDHQAHKDHKDLQVYKVFQDQEVYKVIEVYKDPLEDQGIQSLCGMPGVRGPRGFRGPRGHMTAVPDGSAPTGPNITTLDTTGLETSFQAVGDAMNQLVQKQQITNAQLNHSLQQQQQERGQIVAVMDRVANTTLQSSYDSIFASIPVYDGLDTKEFWSWLHHIESACSYTN